MKFRIFPLILGLNLIGFIVPAQIVKLDSSNLPICIIDTRGKTIANEPKILAHMKIIYNGPGKINKVKDQNFNYSNFIAIEIRGNSSQFYPQKQYSLELRDSTSGKDLDASLIDMPAEEDWILYAPYNDISMIRNVMTYHLWNQMGHWGPRIRFCELILNNEYVGVYILMESIKRNPNRVDIAKLLPEDTVGGDLTGGYIIKIDKKNSPSDLSFISKVKSTSNLDINWLYHYPDSNDIKPVQQNYIRKYIDTVELLIASVGFADPKNGYKKYLSINSFIDYFLITEFSRNIDAYKASSFFYKEKLEADGSKGMLKAGPVWDYNFAFGNASFCSGAQTTGWMYDGCVPATLPTPILWRRLLSDTNYANAVKCRYLELRKTLLDTAYLFQYINRYAFDTLDDAQKRHFTKWKIIGTNPGGFNAYIANSYPDEINRLKTWIRNRLSWMDGNLPGRCTPQPVIAKIEMPLDPECFNGNRPMLQKTQPYNSSPFNYTGLENIKNIPANIIRWVLVELRDPLDSTKIFDRRAALLRSDSVLVDTNFNVGVLFPNALAKQSYYLVVRYDALGFLISKEKVQLPNDNDYNLNRNHRLLTISNESPIIFNSNWLGVDTFYICKGQLLNLNDSNLLKSGYSFTKHDASTSGPLIKLVQTNDVSINFDSAGFYTFQLYLNCNEHTIIRSKLNVRIWPIPKAQILGPAAYCQNDSIRLYSDTSRSYLWSTGERTQHIWVKQSGNYELELTDFNGCSSKAVKLITQFPEIKGKIESGPGTIPGTCKLYFVAEDSLIKYSYLWSNGAQSDTIETTEKQITLLVRDNNQCNKEFVILCNPVFNEESTVQTTQVIPNPNHGAFSILSPASIHQLKIYSSTGLQIYSTQEIEKSLPIQNLSFNNWPTGIYFGKAICDGRQIHFKVLVR